MTARFVSSLAPVIALAFIFLGGRAAAPVSVVALIICFFFLNSEARSRLHLERELGAKAEFQKDLNRHLELRVTERTAELEAANKELESFTYSVAHDLRAPLRHISGFAKLLGKSSARLSDEDRHFLVRINEGACQMGQLVEDLLALAGVGRRELRRELVGLDAVVKHVIAQLKPECEGRAIEWKISPLPFVVCDPTLIRQVFVNLLSNAVKFTGPREKAVIEVGAAEEDGRPVIFVKDNGVGFDMKYADKLFGVFQRLHRQEDFEGTGVGLVTVQRIVHKHGGEVWAKAELNKGASFYFTTNARIEKESKHAV
jgi:light-regulated signal transduction histidine kinase (bacteriophytochrome)